MNKYKKPKFRTVSGSSVGKQRKKVVGCDHCNFSDNHSEGYQPEPTEEDRSYKRLPNKVKFKTNDKCPRCENETIRVFDSKAEFTYANELKLLRDLGEVEDIEYQVRYDLHTIDFETGGQVKVTSYIADFVYFEVDKETGKSDLVVCDVKGGNSEKVVITPEAKLKIDWLEKEYGVAVRIIGR